MAVPFVKMHGLGNDFVVIDARRQPLALTPAATRAIADRHRGVGCDQLIVIEPPPAGSEAAAFMRIRNADGGEVEACGNAARCVARLLMDESHADRVILDTVAGRLDCAVDPFTPGTVSVDMGPARLDWTDIPLARAADTLHLPLEVESLTDPVGVNVGNPHAVFFVDDVAAVDLERLGPRIEHDPLFPERTNVEVAHLAAPDRLRLRVWERGVGITQACGTGACAAAVAAHRRGLTDRKVTVELDGGVLHIAWRDDGRIVMTGPVATSFSGTLGPALLDGGAPW